MKIRIKIRSSNGETYSNDEERPQDYLASTQNPDFMQMIEENVKRSHIEEVEYVKVTVYFGDM